MKTVNFKIIDAHKISELSLVRCSKIPELTKMNYESYSHLNHP